MTRRCRFDVDGAPRVDVHDRGWCGDVRHRQPNCHGGARSTLLDQHHAGDSRDEGESARGISPPRSGLRTLSASSNHLMARHASVCATDESDARTTSSPHVSSNLFGRRRENARLDSRATTLPAILSGSYDSYCILTKRLEARAAGAYARRRSDAPSALRSRSRDHIE